MICLISDDKLPIFGENTILNFSVGYTIFSFNRPCYTLFIVINTAYVRNQLLFMDRLLFKSTFTIPSFNEAILQVSKSYVKQLKSHSELLPKTHSVTAITLYGK